MTANYPRLEKLFAAQVARTPFAIAAICKGMQLSYEELNNRANQLAHHLISLGIGPSTLVPICHQRSLQTLVSILGVLKAGAAYVPLDPAYPLDRLQFMLSDTGANLILTDDRVPVGLSYQGRVLNVEQQAPTISAQPSWEPTVSYGPNDLAYVIYTSGSTGMPKGTMLGHTAVGVINWAGQFYSAEERARVAFSTSISFDPSVLEIFIPLSTGGTVIVKENAFEPFAPDERPSMTFWVPSIASQLCRAGSIPDSIVTINVGGEPLRGAVAADIYRFTTIKALYNQYGPTEASICAAIALVARDTKDDPPIGHPIGDARLFILDKNFRPVPPGVAGELFIGGNVLAQGYLNQPDLTSSRFMDGLLDGKVGRLYRTGDICTQSSTGELRFVGREDHQVKLNGVRIELGEIEHALVSLPAISGAVAVVRQSEAGGQRLVAYVQSDQEALSLGEVRRMLCAWLPDSMLPSQLSVLTNFPLTPSGKVDRRALPWPIQAKIGTAGPFASEIEEAIAEIFKRVLNCTTFGPNDSFFDGGGDSLMMVQAALRLEELLGYSIPPALIRHASSPRALAEALERCPPCETGHISILQRGDGPSLFCVSDLFDRPFNYLSLIRKLSSARSIYGLAPGPLEQAFIAKPDVEVLTRAYLVALQSAQPRGPYFLIGYSAGGVFAFDLARTLEARGEQVSLVLLDSPRSDKPPSPSALLRWAYTQTLYVFHQRNFPNRVARLYKKRSKMLDILVPANRRAAPDWIPKEKKALADSLLRAIGSYTYGKFSGRVLLVKCLDRDRLDDLMDHDNALGWASSLTGSLTTVRVNGDHYSFMREPCVADVACHIENFLGADLSCEKHVSYPMALAVDGR